MWRFKRRGKCTCIAKDWCHKTKGCDPSHCPGTTSSTSSHHHIWILPAPPWHYLPSSSHHTLQYLLPTAYLASIIRQPGSSRCIVPQMGLELMSLLGFWSKESSMQCVNINVITREFVLARHLPNHEDIAHQRREKELGGESRKLDMLREKFLSPKFSEFVHSMCHVIDSHTHTTTPLLISAQKNTPFTALILIKNYH